MVKTLPTSGVLSTVISPPRRSSRVRLDRQPKPVPPKRRAVVPSPWANASNIRCCCSVSMPMPVSVTEIAIDREASAQGLRGFRAPTLCSASPISTRTSPDRRELEGVGQQILEDLPQPLGVRDDSASVCWQPARSSSRGPSCVPRVRTPGADRAAEPLPSDMSAISTETVPDSTLARSRMSFRSASRSRPDARMTVAYLTWVSVMLWSGLSSKLLGQHQRLLSGVRSSWDMLAMNSDLYFDDTASCSAFSSSSRFDCSTSRFFFSRLDVLARPAAWPDVRDRCWIRGAPLAGNAGPRPATGTA